MRIKIVPIAMALLLSCPGIVFARAAVYGQKIKPEKIKKVASDVKKNSVDNREYFEESFPRDEEIKKEEQNSGSLWVDSYASRLYNNLHRAATVGDMVTILIEEEAQGTKSAETKLDRKSKHIFGEAGLMGLAGKVAGAVSGFDPANIINAKNEAKHDGKGETKRKGELQASITARVVKVLKNGDMQVRAQKNIRVNGEEQTLILEGFIRPYDISADNTILSTYLADARITFNGFGVVSEQQKPGWLSRILQRVLPF
jgi:flagellar L-ring protein precursor FlgH